MPYELYKNGKKTCVRNKDTGESKGCSDSKSKAIAHMRALYAAEGGSKMGSKELNDLVEMAVKEYNAANPDDAIKEEEMSVKGYVPYGLTSFSQLSDFRKAQEIQEEVFDLSSDFLNLVGNVLFDTNVIDKGAAVKSLADEFQSLLPSVSSGEQEADDAEADATDKPAETEPVEDTAMATMEAKEASIVEKLWNKFVALVKGKGESPVVWYSDDGDGGVTIYKGSDGGMRWFARYTNKFRDDDNPSQIISEKAHKRFEVLVDKGLAPMPVLMLWHVKEWKFGQADWLAYDDNGFMVASGTIDNTKEAHAIANAVKGWVDLQCSHGMPVRTIKLNKENPSVIDEYETREISFLPGYAAANKLTEGLIKEESMAIPDAKRNALIGRGIPASVLDGLEKANEKDAKFASDHGVESKEKTEDTPAEVVAGTPESATPPADETPAPASSETPAGTQQLFNEQELIARMKEAHIYATVDEVEKSLGAVVQEMFKQMKELTDKVNGLETSLKEMSTKEDERLAALLRNTPQSSVVAALMGERAIGSKEAKIRSDGTLGKDKPKEAPVETEPMGATLVPFINQMMAGK